MSNYKVMVVGMGKRGKHHATYFHKDPNFEVVGICDIFEQAAIDFAPEIGNPKVGTDAAAMANELKPDLFCFATLPNIRTEMIQIAIDCGAKMIAFEKPVALSSEEGLKIKKLLEGKDIKVVVSHQHRYGDHYQAVNEIIKSGKIGKVHTVYGYAQGWSAHMLSHIIDYSMWFNGYSKPKWVMAAGEGRTKLSDPKKHLSPDYVGGFVQYENGVRGIYECGAGCPDIPEVERWWGKNKMGAIGTEGYAEVYTGNGFKAVTKDGIITGEGVMNYDLDMPGYIADMAAWLDDDNKVHECCFENAYAGFDIMMGMFRGTVEGGQIALPLTEGKDELAELNEKLPDNKVINTLEESDGEYDPR